MEQQKTKPLTTEQLKLVNDGLQLLDEHLLAVCEGCQFRHHTNDCPMEEADGRMCFDNLVWGIDFMKTNIRSLYLREKLNLKPEEKQ